MLSIFDMFSVGIGPSSSHTVGPMRAGKAFSDALARNGLLGSVARIHVVLYGSLSRTGKGHGTDRAVAAGLEGWEPETVDPGHVLAVLDECCQKQEITLNFNHTIPFYREDIKFDLWRTPDYHPNGMEMKAFDASGNELYSDTVYSVGGGFIIHGSEISGACYKTAKGQDPAAVPHPFANAAELVDICGRESKSIADIVWENELASHTEDEIKDYIHRVWHFMHECITNGCLSEETILPGGLRVHRRAPGLYRALARTGDTAIFGENKELISRPLSTTNGSVMEWVDLFALAVNEENAGGGRIVTAPTNGAAGIVPAVLHYYWYFIDNADEAGVTEFLLTASAIGYLFKRNASISGAEVGCQGEVGSACSMAAGGLCAVLGGTPAQVENAAEIGIEHNLGLTCDPVGGLVQIPCIERNAMASNTAINAARMALLSNGSHIVSLDSAIETMRQTGHDMMSKYRETSEGGLAVNVVEC